MKIAILSGKGGTGKTTVASAFIRFSGAKALADCDVDAPNLHLVSELKSEPFSSDYLGLDKACIDAEKCIGFGKCAELCRFDAIKLKDGVYAVDEYSCEGCAVCQRFCPSEAISMEPDVAGKLDLYIDDAVFSTAEPRMGRGNSGKLVSQVKQSLFRTAPETGLAIIDGSPGIGCPVISSVSGVDLALIVAEPTISGISDLSRLLKTCFSLHVNCAVCVNKCNVDMEKAGLIKSFCEENDIDFVGMLPFDKHASEAINKGLSVADLPCPLRDALKDVFETTMKILKV